MSRSAISKEEATPARSASGWPEYLARWIGYQRARGIRSLTLESYEGYIRREIAPVIGGLEIGRIRPGHVRAVLIRMQQRGISAPTIAQARGVLGSALRQAMEEGLIRSNPVTAVKRPRIRRPECHWPTPSQLTALIEALAGTIWEVPFLLSAVTGARRSEVLGLAWEDVDLRSGTLHIRRSVQRMPGDDEAGTIAFTPLKTKRARRLVQLPAFALDRIRSHRRHQLERRTVLGARWQDPLDEEGAPVALCERGDGSFLHPDSFTHAFKRLGSEAGLHPSTRLHDVRHAVATELGRQGVHGVIVSAVLGHASPAFTVAVYQHAWQEGPYEAAAALEKALGFRPHPRWQSVGTRLSRDGYRARRDRELAGQERGSPGNRTLNLRIKRSQRVLDVFQDLAKCCIVARQAHD